MSMSDRQLEVWKGKLKRAAIRLNERKLEMLKAEKEYHRIFMHIQCNHKNPGI